MKRAGIYRIVHLPTGREYVGSAVCLVKRFRLHRINLNAGKHHCRHLQAAWLKYGAEQFSFQVIELVVDVGALIKREQFHIDARRPAFNMCRVAGSRLGQKHTEETKRKLSAALKGKTLWSAEDRQRMSRQRRGKPVHTVAAKARMSVLVRGRNPDWKLKLSRATVGKPKPVGFGNRLSIAIIGHSVSPETRAKISAGHKGVPWSAEARKAHMTANQIRKETP